MSDNYYFINRYNADGSIDDSFGNNGVVNSVETIGQNIQSYISAMVVLTDNSLLIRVANLDMFSNYTTAFIKYDPTGEVDHSFEENGVKFYPNNRISPTCMILDSNQKPVLVGVIRNDDEWVDSAVARLNTDGSFDTTFGTNGTTSTAVSAENDDLYAIALQNGKLVALGNAFGIFLTRYSLQNLARESFQKSEFVYPNPAEDFLHFSDISEGIEIFDIQGRMVKQQTDASTILDVSNLVSGVYLLSYVSDGKNFKQKFVRK